MNDSTCRPVAAGCPAGPIELSGRRWCLGDKLGSGSYGVVYKGTAEDDPSLLVAVKVFTGSEGSARHYYQEELGAAEGLVRGGCVPEFACLLAHGVARCGDASYFCMVFPLALGDLSKWIELVNGSPIQLSRIVPTPRQRVYEPYYFNLNSMPNSAEIKHRLVGCLVDALTFLKEEGLSHRDIKPPNMLVYGSLEDPQFVVGDLGSICVRPVAEAEFQGVPVCKANTSLRGTPDYLPWSRMRTEAVKMLHGESTSDLQYHSLAEMQWADVFAAGCTIYEFLTGLMAASLYMAPEDNPRAMGEKYYPLVVTENIEYVGPDGAIHGMDAAALESMVNTMIFSETPREAAKWAKHAAKLFYTVREKKRTLLLE